MSTLHTPGPWSVNDWPQATTDIAIGAVGTPLIAKVPLRDVSINEQKANARLIAAAPDLLGVIKTLVDACEGAAAQGGHTLYIDLNNCLLLDDARAAIAKAEAA